VAIVTEVGSLIAWSIVSQCVSCEESKARSTAVGFMYWYISIEVTAIITDHDFIQDTEREREREREKEYRVDL
jgi:hypothetical protein